MRASRLAALLLLSAACGKSGTGTDPGPDLESITVTGSPPSSAFVGSTLTASFLVLHGPAGSVTTPRSGKAVTITVLSGGGLVAGAATTVVTTGTDGVASVSWQLGPVAGPDVVRGTINGSQTADLTVVGTVAPVAHLTLEIAPTPNPQSGIPFFQQPVVRLSSPLGAPVLQAGIPVTVAVTSGSGTLGVATPGGPAQVASLVVNTNGSGQANFADLMLTGGGATTLEFTAPGYASVSSSGISLTASPTVFTLTNGNEAGPFSSTAGSQTYATFAAPAGSTELQVGTYNGTGTAHLYARRGAYPTSTSYDCASTGNTTSQLCSASGSVEGIWYLVANGVTTYQNALARAVAYGPSCARSPLSLGTGAAGTLSLATDCLVPANQGPRDRFSLVSLVQQAVAFTVTSTSQVGVQLKSALSSRTRIGFGASGGTTGPFLLAPGDHDVEVTDGTVGLQGGQSYTLTAAVTSPNLASCGPVAMYETGVTATLTLAATDCTGILPTAKSDRFYTWALTGQTIVVTMSSTAFDPFLRVLGGQSLGTASVLQTDDNSGGGTTARVSYTNLGPPADFTIEATTTLAGGLGSYTLSFDLTPSVYNAPLPSLLRRRSP